MFLSKKRALWSGIIAFLLVVYSMNFIGRNVAIMAERSLGRQIFNYFVNIILFSIIIYLLVSLVVWVIHIFRKHH